MSEELEHMTYSDKLGIRLFSLKRGSGNPVVVFFCPKGCCRENKVRLFSDVHEERSEDNTHGLEEGNSKRMEGKDSPPQQCLRTGTDCPEGKGDLYPRRFSEHTWIKYEQLDLALKSVLIRAGTGLKISRIPLSSATFYDSMYSL
ncbi:hypothetical protein BTVI_107703 [Pitangus sulphuratus]|nr:hypothetical protein BTVI_107703 [Pitangus sulphuratus]